MNALMRLKTGKRETYNITMELRAVIKRKGKWWIGWLVDIPGVNAQERTRKKLIESLRIGTNDIMTATFEINKEEELVVIEV